LGGTVGGELGGVVNETEAQDVGGEGGDPGVPGSVPFAEESGARVVEEGRIRTGGEQVGLLYGVVVGCFGVGGQDAQAGADAFGVPAALPVLLVDEVVGGDESDVGAQWPVVEDVFAAEAVVEEVLGQVGIEV